MKLLNNETKKPIVCPKCGGKVFKEWEPTTTSTIQIWCAKGDCNTDLLIPTKDVLKTKIIVKVK